MTVQFDDEPSNGDAAVFPRISTGNSEADSILNGGFPANSINIIMGQPGTGKTIFAEQLLFHNAGFGRPLLYLTTLSEPIAKVVSYAQRLEFFRLEDVGAKIIYDDLGAELAANGPASLVPRIRDMIKTYSPAILIVDSFKAVHDLSESTPEMRRLVSELASVMSAYSVTVFLLGEYTQQDIESFPEFAIADSILQLERKALSARDERYLRVLKLRGSGYREGQHAFRIRARGLQIFPRLVTPDFESYAPTLERIPTGVPGLDDVLGGGLWRGSTTLVVGPTGSGKSTMALQFAVQGHRGGEPALFVNFQENPSQISRMLAALGVDPSAARDTGFHHLYVSPVELQIDSVIIDIFEFIARSGVKRVVIDAVGDLMNAATDPGRLHDFLYSLTQHFVVRNVTSWINAESAIGLTGADNSNGQWSYMSDNVLLLERDGGASARRTLRVIKTRNTSHDEERHIVEITTTGVRIL